MTTPAQQSLRRVVKNYVETTRFAFCVNDPSKILEAIQSRCAVLYFSKLEDEAICQRLISICKAESVMSWIVGLERMQ